MSAATDNRNPRPWYREPWPWALMLPPLLAVIGGITMILLATRTPSALVVEDYARIEELTAERFERDLTAVRLGLAATLTAMAEAEGGSEAGGEGRAEGEGGRPGRLEVSLTAPAGFTLPRALLLRLHHATDPNADREVRLVRFGSVYAADVEYLPGRYGVEILPEDESWRLSTPVARLQGEIRLTAQAAGG